MRWLSEADYQKLIERGVLLTSDGYGPKVYRLQSGLYLKLFRPKRIFTLANLIPYAERFRRNTEKLVALGIPTVSCKEVLKIPSIQRWGVLYMPLEGEPLREIPANDFPIANFARFFADLHELGIYFRSCHLGNILKVASNDFGLIDVADMRFKRRPLSGLQRLRNFQHLLRYSIDKERLALGEGSAFWENYFSNTTLKVQKQHELKHNVLKRVIHERAVAE